MREHSRNQHHYRDGKLRLSSHVGCRRKITDIPSGSPLSNYARGVLQPPMVGLLSRRALAHPASYHTRHDTRARPLLLPVVYHYVHPADLLFLTDRPDTCLRAHRPTDARIILWAPWAKNVLTRHMWTRRLGPSQETSTATSTSKSTQHPANQLRSMFPRL